MTVSNDRLGAEAAADLKITNFCYWLIFAAGSEFINVCFM